VNDVFLRGGGILTPISYPAYGSTNETGFLSAFLLLYVLRNTLLGSSWLASPVLDYPFGVIVIVMHSMMKEIVHCFLHSRAARSRYCPRILYMCPFSGLSIRIIS
jgi:hypothetical protein